VHVALAQRGLLRQRTAPYLGAACLALLALASAHTLSAELAQLAVGPGLPLAPTTWLAGTTSSHTLLGAATALATRGATHAQRSGESPFAATSAWLAAPHARSSHPAAAPLTQGALAVPALLVAVTLALCH
jgi:hypothetical protein